MIDRMEHLGDQNYEVLRGGIQQSHFNPRRTHIQFEPCVCAYSFIHSFIIKAELNPYSILASSGLFCELLKVHYSLSPVYKGR